MRAARTCSAARCCLLHCATSTADSKHGPFRDPTNYVNPVELATARVMDVKGRRSQSPLAWYKSFSGQVAAPVVAVALKICSIPASAAGGERVWSAVGRHLVPSRASTLMGRAGMEAFIYYNQRVLDRMNRPVAPISEWAEQSEAAVEFDAAGLAHVS